MKRRLFVATTLLLAAFAPAADTLRERPRPVGSPGGSPIGQKRLVRVAGTAFGTTISLAALAPADDEGGAHTRAVLRSGMQEVQRIDALLSLHRPDSQLSTLNRRGELHGAHEHLLRNLAFARELSAQTDGAFDITVQPLWELFAREKENGRLPTRRAIAQARALVDYRAVRVDGDRVVLDRKGASVTLNSLAQGYAVDVVLAILRQGGIDAALIDTGELGNLGERSDQHPWTVGVQHPREPAGCIAPITMDGRVLSTSGDYATHFTDDFRYHHIFDPATGISPPAWSSTVVMAPSGLVADGLSTALMVLDRAAGEQLVRRYAHADALWIDKDARLARTAGVPFAS